MARNEQGGGYPYRVRYSTSPYGDGGQDGIHQFTDKAQATKFRDRHLERDPILQMAQVDHKGKVTWKSIR